MNKRQLIDDIRRYNSTAQPHFLAQFDEAALKQYLDHLEEARRKHVRTAAFVRRGPKLRLVSYRRASRSRGTASTRPPVARQSRARRVPSPDRVGARRVT